MANKNNKQAKKREKNQRKKQSKIDKKLNKVQAEVNKVEKIISYDKNLNVIRKKNISNRLDVNPMSLRGKGLADKFRVMKVAEYLFGATHPKYAVENMLDVKLPTDLPVPTACIRVTKTVQISTGATGIVYVNYIPGALIRTNFSAGTVSSLTVNTSCNGNGTAGSNTYYNFDSTNLTQVWDKWRLTASVS